MNITEKIIICILYSIVISCNVYKYDREFCPHKSGNFGNNIYFGTYINTEPEYYIDYDGFVYYAYRNILYSTELTLNNDSTFSLLGITIKGNDTIKSLKGNFKIYQDTDFAWYVLKLNADSIYEKDILDTISGIAKFTDFKASEYIPYRDSLLLNVDTVKNCFSLAVKSEPTGLPFECKETTLIEIETSNFCLKFE
ncbi:hypothetical protein AGMMS49938_12120 [Fibrobacterales bacterium]|nr:hypothetical protein AGMMS49938_12120 [Fibrobacterales bacterium]